MLLFRKGLCKAVCRLQFGREVVKGHVPNLKFLVNVIILNINICDGHAPRSHMIPHLSSFRL